MNNKKLSEIKPPQNLINWFIDLPLELKVKLYNHWVNTVILGLESEYVRKSERI